MSKRVTLQSKILRLVPALVNGPSYYSQQEWLNIQEKASYFQQTLESTDYLLTNIQPILKQLAAPIDPYYLYIYYSENSIMQISTSPRS